jgi:putative glutamate/gamma-aminobutyrate antiporter
MLSDVQKDPSIALRKNPILSVFSLVMINVIAVGSLRTLPISATYGAPLLFYYLLCGLLFFIPVALVTAELATAWPKSGGIYVWVREAFGPRWAFFVVWIQWIYNVVWYPTILGFVAATAAYVIDPALANNQWYVLSTVLIVFWLATAVNCGGMHLSSAVSTVGSIIGTLFPMLVIIGLGCYWWMEGRPTQISLSWEAVIPTIERPSDLVLMTGILFGLIGLEMSAVHAQEVKNPEKNYPKALLYSVMLILGSLILASWVIAAVVPHPDLNLVTGMLQAFQLFFDTFGIGMMTPWMALFMILGALGAVVTWIVGPTKGLLAAADDRNLPAWLARRNKRGMPVAILVTQAVIVSLLSFGYLLLPTVVASYWALTALTAILALLMYVLMFMAAIKLRYKYPTIKRPYRIPGVRNLGMWLVGLVGGIFSLLAMILCFWPPSEVAVGSTFEYVALLIGGTLLAGVPVLFLSKKKGSD